MPPTGTMQVHTQRGSLPGHEGHGIIQITYSFSPGYNVRGGGECSVEHNFIPDLFPPSPFP